MGVTVNVPIEQELTDARRRTLALVEPFDDEFLRVQHSPLMSPLVWDLAHVGNYEELWLVRALGGEALRPDLDDLYDAFRHPRADRPALPLLGPADALRYIASVRERAIEILRTRDGGGEFFHRMVVQHEHQHDETMTATIQLSGAPVEVPAAHEPRLAAGSDGAGRADVALDGGTYEIGTDGDPWAYDNERPAHTVELRPLSIDLRPVTNEAWLAFMAAGGYHDERLWSAAGWRWRRDHDATAPLYWLAEGGREWSRLRFGTRAAPPPDEPVTHVCWYEAKAFARWCGARLPTEQEWEAAHRVGLLEGTGMVWEWTASDFLPWPGFCAHPYREYSEVFFGSDYKVLRGGSFATHHTVLRPTFRNWDFPIRRQIFSGVRLAHDR